MVQIKRQTKRKKRFSLFAILGCGFVTLLTVTGVVVLLQLVLKEIFFLPSGFTTSSSSRLFFPEFGTDYFFHQCPWTAPAQRTNCTFLVNVPPGMREGMTDWISSITTAYLLSQQTRCNLYFTYADSVDIDQVLTPCGSGAPHWSLPADFSCNFGTNCFRHNTDVNRIASALSEEVGYIISPPSYRMAFAHSVREPVTYDSSLIQQRLPGFDVDRGMACALGSLFCLSPQITTFVPDLWTRILPTLREEHSLVLTLYVRTGRTDVVAKQQAVGAVEEEPTIGAYMDKVQPSLDCALQLEQEYLRRSDVKSRSIHQVVWMLLSDSPRVKDWVKKTYDSGVVHAPSTSLPRLVVTTAASGRHTRPRGNPSTADFAEAFIDWYLIGESDVVILNSELSFGPTGGLRTNRPLYSGKTCLQPTLFQTPP